MVTGFGESHTHKAKDPPFLRDPGDLETCWEQCGFKPKPSTSFWSIGGQSVCMCSPPAFDRLNVNTPFAHWIWVYYFALGHTHLLHFLHMRHMERWGRSPVTHTQVWPWQFWGHCHIFNKWLPLDGKLVKMFPWTHRELQQEETLHHWEVTLMYSIRFAYHVKEHIKRKCLEKGCHYVVWWIENS